MTEVAAVYDALEDEVSRVLVGQEETLRRLTISLLTDGHILLEGVPGVAKTTLAHAFARASGLQFNRVQMTPDILPADITGTSVYRQETGEFELQRGPVFANLVVADEINRATPKTQSALLEAMEERQVSIEGETLPLPNPFMVIATQNPLEMDGTFDLPEAQRDRFQLKLTVDIPQRDHEREVLDRFNETPTLGPAEVSQVVDPEEITAAKAAVADIHVAPELREYVLDIVARTRTHGDVAHGASPRASLAFLHTSKARAALHGREYVIPDDVKALAVPILRHRLILTTEAQLGDVTPEAVIDEVLGTVTPPSASQAAEDEGEPVSADGNGRPETSRSDE